MDIKVRIATPDDVDDMMGLALMASEENGFVDPVPENLLREIYPALCLDNGIVGIIGGRGNPAEGAILLRIGKLWYSDSPLIEERAIFIHPDYRSAKGGRAARLCEFSKNTADMMGLPLMIGVLSSSRTLAKVKMYERHFGPQAGAFFLYGTRTGRAAQ